MSGTQVSSAPNVLFDPMMALRQQEGQNQLLQQQQTIGANDIEMGSRIAATLMDPNIYPTPEARAAAYPTLVGYAQRQGYLKQAPPTYPGDDQTQALARMGVSLKDQYNMGFITPPGLAETLKNVFRQPVNTPAAAGGGTNAPAGTSTPASPQNLADIHPDLTQFRLPSGAGATVAKSAAPQFQGLLTDLEAAGYKLDPDTTGGYNPRNIAGTNTPSQHAYGLAMDVNWARNPRGANTQADIPPDLARSLAAKWGLTWGGDWQGADRDPMHFEVARGSGPGTDHPKGAATGWNANNPLNITTDTGGVVTPAGARLATYGSMADGVAATAAKLQSYQTDRGLNTVRQMYTEWHKGSPVNDADMQRIAGAMGVGVDQPFQLDPTKTAAWISAAQPGETGTAGKRLSQADIAAGVRQASAAPQAVPGGVAARTGGTNVAGPGAGSGAVAPAPGQVAPTPAPGQAAPAPGGATTTQQQQPAATTVGTGVNSPQYQQAQQMLRQAAAIEIGPGGQLPQAKAAVAYLKSQAQLMLQTDSVVQTPQGQVHTLTGKIDDPAKPLADYHETTPGSGIWVGGPGTEPRFQPPGRLVVGPDGTVWQTSVGGAKVLQPSDPQAIAARKEAEAAGTATGTTTVKKYQDLVDRAQNAAQQEGQIDYATNQLREAAKGGIPSGYFSDALAAGAAAAKSLGLDGPLRAVGINPEAVGNIQTAQKTLSVIGGAILRQALGPGSAITDGKIEAFIHTQPGIMTDPRALERIMAWARSQYTYEREMGHAAVAEAAKQENAGRLPPNWLAAYYRDHGFAPIYDPVTGEMQQPDGRQPTRETPAAATLPAAARSSLKEGHETTFGNGQVWTLRNGQPVQVR